MIRHCRIPIHRLILSLSDALDHVCPEIADHQQRVTYIAVHVAHRMGFDERSLSALFLAAALHDIGMIHMENKLEACRVRDRGEIPCHGEKGYELLKGCRLFRKSATMVRFHHRAWAFGEGAQWDDDPVPLASHVIHLADAVEQRIDRKVHVLHQAEEITAGIVAEEGERFHPDIVAAFREASRTEAFWLDTTSPRIYSLLQNAVDTTLLDATDEIILEIAEIFGQVIDAMSPWTANHSARVAAAAVAVAEQAGFTDREQLQIRTAGLLHDVGKLTVPKSILENPSRLTGKEWAVLKGHTYQTFHILETTGFPQHIVEWAAFHHERMDGAGYPFHHKGMDLSLGSRIMAVADIYAALTEDRPYRNGISPDNAVRTLYNMAETGAVDPSVVDLLALNRDRVEEILANESPALEPLLV